MQVTVVAVLCLTNTVVDVDADQCPASWTYRVADDACYRYFSSSQHGVSSVSYDNAKKSCENYGGQLAAPETKTMNDFLRNLTKTPDVWVPLTDGAKEGVWVWDSGNPVSWTNWHSGYPRSSTAYNCAYMNSDGTWYSYSCGGTRGYVCRLPVHVVFNITGDNDNITMMCQAGGGYSLAAFMQIMKIKADGTEQPLVEMIPGAQEPFFTDDDFIERSVVSGNLDSRQGQVYLKVVVTKPGWKDAGDYRCSLTYIGTNHHLGGVVSADYSLKD